MSTGTRTEIVSVDGNYGKVVSRTEATLPNVGTVPIVGIEFPGGDVHFCESARVGYPTYNASVDLDQDVDTIEEAAAMLIDFIRGDTEGPIYVEVRIDGDRAPTKTVSVTFDENGRAVGTLDG